MVFQDLPRGWASSQDFRIGFKCDRNSVQAPADPDTEDRTCPGAWPEENVWVPRGRWALSALRPPLPEATLPGLGCCLLGTHLSTEGACREDAGPPARGPATPSAAASPPLPWQRPPKPPGLCSAPEQPPLPPDQPPGPPEPVPPGLPRAMPPRSHARPVPTPVNAHIKAGEQRRPGDDGEDGTPSAHWTGAEGLPGRVQTRSVRT